MIVDDEELARELLESHLSQLNGFEVVASCASAIEASQMIKEKRIDLLFLDIEMPVLKGTDFYKNLIHKPKVIFTTAYRDYALDGFELDAVDYLLKPIVFARFFKAIEKFNALNSPAGSLPTTAKTVKKPNYIFVRKDRKQVKIALDDILYIQGLKDYVQIHLTSGSHVVKQTIRSFSEILGPSFARVHRSYIVNKKHVTAYTTHDIEIGDYEIPIGESYRATALKALTSD
jgi:DNA-binding LytR/AlgR family response regulator